LRLMQYFVLAAAVMATTLAGATRAEDREVYLVRYAEFMPNEEVSGANLLEQYGDASRREDGNLRVEVLHEAARPGPLRYLGSLERSGRARRPR
jgi:hypothetical protein